MIRKATDFHLNTPILLDPHTKDGTSRTSDTRFSLINVFGIKIPELKTWGRSNRNTRIQYLEQDPLINRSKEGS